jgi:hypothetical protein
MLSTGLGKRSVQALAAILVLSVLLTTTIALAAAKQKFIRGNKGGTVTISRAVQLVVPPGAVDKNTYIQAEMVRTTERVIFKFRPEGLVFKEGIPAELQADLKAVSDAVDLKLYFAPDEADPDNYTEVIYPDITDEKAVWRIEHFSIYYFRRR